MRKREELGIYCRSFPYLTEVCQSDLQIPKPKQYNHSKIIYGCFLFTGSKKNDSRLPAIPKKHVHGRSTTNDKPFQTKLIKIVQKVDNELELSSYTTKSPIAVFDYLASIVEQHLIVPEQKTVRDILMKIRNNELLRCLFNVTSYLGKTDDADKLIAELQNLYHYQATRSGRVNVELPSPSSKLNSNNQNREQLQMSANGSKVNI